MIRIVEDADVIAVIALGEQLAEIARDMADGLEESGSRCDYAEYCHDTANRFDAAVRRMDFPDIDELPEPICSSARTS
jgi:hypothetical protein